MGTPGNAASITGLAWTWAAGHPAITAAITAAAAAAVFLLVRAVRRRSLASVLRAVAIPLVLLWEAQGLYEIGTGRLHAPPLMALALAGITSANLLTFAAYADHHFRLHKTLGPNGRRMWYVAFPMGLVVALNSHSPAEAALRVVLPLLSVVAFQAAYLPDEPEGAASRKRGSFRLTPRRLGVTLGWIDPSDADLTEVHAERRIRQLTAHAAGYHLGFRLARRWHAWRCSRLIRTADDEMLAEAARRVRRVHDGLDKINPAAIETPPPSQASTPPPRQDDTLPAAPAAPQLAASRRQSARQNASHAASNASRNGTPRTASRDTIRQLLDAHYPGKTLGEIAEMAGVSERTVSRIKNARHNGEAA